MNAKGGNGGGLRTTKDFGELSSHQLSQQLDALGLDDDDDDGGDDTFDPMNISDFLNSNGDLTGFSEWTDSEHDEVLLSTATPKHRATSEMSTVTQPVVQEDDNSKSNSNSNVLMLRSPHANCNTPGSPCSSKSHRHPVPNPGCRVFSDSALSKAPAVTSAWQRHLLPGTRTEQIYTRAPNFRTPGGYKPPAVETEPRNLTDEQILQEVKEMYAEDRLLHGEGDVDVPDSTNQDKDSLEFLLADLQLGKRTEEGKDGESQQLLPVDEPLVTKSKGWVCKLNEDTVSQDSLVKASTNPSKIIPSIINTPPSGVPLSRRSPNSRKDNLAELSRLWDEIQDTKQRLEHDMSSLVSPRPSGTPGTVEDNQQRKVTPCTVVKPMGPQQPNFPSCRRNLSFGKRAFVPQSQPPIVDCSRDDKTRDGGDAADGESTNSPGKVMPKRSVRRSKGKHRHSRYGNRAGSFSALVPFKPRIPYTEDELGLDQFDVEEILHEANIHESELDDILSEISDHDHVPDVGVSGIKDFFKYSNSLGDFQRGNEEGEEGYKRKYFEERYRRDHCENEISKLQKQLLEVNEKVSVSDGLLRGKETTITKLNKVYQRLQTQWKSHEKGCKEEVTQLKAQNAQLRGRLTESKERISAYEEELERAIDVSQVFQEKVQLALEDLEAEKIEGRERKEELETQMRSLESSLATAQAEKDSGLRALRDCQESLDVTKKSLADTTEEVRAMKVDQGAQEAKFQALSTQNQALTSQLSEILNEKSELRSTCAALEGEIGQLKEEKGTLEADYRRKVKEEREKLHDYYNNKIKEILQVESQKMIEAEREFIALHEQKLVLTQGEATERLEAMRTKFTHQVQQMKSKYESHLGSLKKENEEQAKLIGTVSQQLRNFSERDEQDAGGHGEKGYCTNTLDGSSCHDSISSLVEAFSGRRGRLDIPQPPHTANNNKVPSS